jgi:protein SCO1/2
MKNLKTLLLVAGGLLVLAAIVLLGMQIFASSQAFRGSEIEPSPAAFDFDIQQANGTSYHLSAERGKVVLLYFGYTNCPDYCPATLAKYQNIYQRLGDDVANVDFVFITVDPQRDTPQVLADYVRRVNPAFVGLSGSEEQLRPIWQAYFVGQQIVPLEGSALGYSVDHSTRVYVIDKFGNLRLTFPFEMEADDMAHDVSLLLAE